jgi:transposase InsO family protein
MDERVRFIAGLQSGLGMAEACRSYGVSRKTGYKWLERYKVGGPSGLEERSRAPHRMPWAIEDEMQELLIAARCQHPSWGPRKLLAWLERRHRGRHFPAPSSVGDLLRRRGLVKPRRRRRRVQPRVARPGRYDAPNATWCADFKGWFRTGDGERCDPLTISDGYSRFVLGCHIVERPTLEHVQPQFERVFVEYGLPTAIRTDNGPPFASTGLGGLSRLAVWWLRLGITPDRIEPGRPEQNGRHERFHKTLKARRLRRLHRPPQHSSDDSIASHGSTTRIDHTSPWLTTHQPTSTRHHVGPFLGPYLTSTTPRAAWSDPSTPLAPSSGVVARST